MARQIILHYHLFKNAGTSIDEILKSNFGDKWVTAEFDTSTHDNSADIAKWIEENPEAIAFSTHTGVGPIPKIEGVEICSIMMLRNPLDRIISAYKFESKQDSDTWGAQLAKETDLEGYIKARLQKKNDRQCQNFQCERLASLCPGEENELRRALAGMREITVLGLVEAFDHTVEKMAFEIQKFQPEFEWEATHANVSSGKSATLKLSRRALEWLALANRDDLAIWEIVNRSFTLVE